MEDEDMSSAAATQFAPEYDVCPEIELQEHHSAIPARDVRVPEATRSEATSAEDRGRDDHTEGEVQARGPDDLEVAEEESDDALLTELRGMGRQVTHDILSQPDYLSGTAFAKQVGMSRQALDKRRQDGTVLGLQGEKRGYRYPAWQIIQHPGGPTLIMPALKEVLPRLLEALGGPWAVHSFLFTSHGSLQGRTPIQALRSGDSNSVLELVENARYGGGV
ncbi:hypothetical protein [Roseospira navarrensis]|uniref:Antitoxin Xre/MbcA/ParS-like toxin-binding domain-containing protein n=1 Tax=Roseospira navarrensis TaxID=140058 RepID=A0A7X1ZH81_9PROT|nr:hypothetical protein [Roseospira navarrensis]MQX37412.1 hypothetical protein [Roseospira navarrensis]